MSTGTVLELVGVGRTYPGHTPVVALDRVDLAIAAGELLAIVGPSGSGKSTLLHVMGTLEQPTTGAVLVEGRDTTALSDAELSRLRSTSIGFVFQQFFLLDGMTAAENVAAGLVYQGLRPAERRARAAEALEQVGLGPRAGHLPNQLSGGERQRVAIARALAARPAVVLADEPTGNLDSVTGARIVDLLHDLNAAGVTIVVITHDRDLAGALPRQVTMRDGRVESDTARAEVAA